MRTTIDIDDDVLAAAKELAHRQKVSAGKVVSQLLRASLVRNLPLNGDIPHGTKTIGGFKPFISKDSKVVTNEVVEQLREDEGI